jgi:hypothetical protein
MPDLPGHVAAARDLDQQRFTPPTCNRRSDRRQCLSLEQKKSNGGGHSDRVREAWIAMTPVVAVGAALP